MAYATWNASDKNAFVGLSGGDLIATCNASGMHIGVRATLPLSGKRYWEITITTKGGSGVVYLGVADTSMPLDIRVGFDTHSHGYASGSGGKVYNAVDDTYGASYTQSDVISIAYDADTGKIWWAKNGTWAASGDPAAGTNAAFTGIAGTQYPVVSLYYSGTAVTANFGASAFAYSPPSGFIGVSDSNEYPVETADGAGVADTVSAFSLTDGISDGAGVADTTEFVREIPRGVDDGVGVADVISLGLEGYRSTADTAGVADTIEAFNWTRFLAQNAELALRLFYCVLSGDADGTTDLTLPISSFQARVRTGEPSYLSVVVPSVDYAADVSARQNGTLRVDMAYLVGGVEYHRETIARGLLTNIRKDEGSKSASMTLTAYQTETFVAKSVTLVGVTYKSTDNGKRTFRLSWPDLYLKPGDTAVYGADSITVGMLSFTISSSGQNAEVQEA